MHSHVTAEEVFMQIQKNHPNISRATVYRNLNILYEEGKIGRISVPDNAAKFDFMPAHHYHVRCEKCDKLFDVDMKDFDSGGMFVSSGDFVNANGRIKYLCKKYLTDIISSI